MYHFDNLIFLYSIFNCSFSLSLYRVCHHWEISIHIGIDDLRYICDRTFLSLHFTHSRMFKSKYYKCWYCVAHYDVQAYCMPHTFMCLFPFGPFNFKWITLALCCTVCCVLHCYSITHYFNFNGWVFRCVCDVRVFHSFYFLLFKTISISTRTSVWPMVKRSENLKFITNHLFVCVCCVLLFVSYTVQIKSIYVLCCARALRLQLYAE